MAFDQSQYDLSANPLSGGGSYGEGRISDALQRLRGLQGALQSGDIDYATYQKLFQQFDPQAVGLANSITGSGSKQATAGNNAGANTLGQLSQIGGQQDLGTFASIFKNLTGKDASAQDITGYFSTVAPELQALPGGASNVQDVHTLINQYLSDQYQPQIQGYQQQQQQTALDKAQQQAQGMIQKQNQLAVQNLTDPQTMQQIEGSFNQNGLLNSGAFSNRLADQLSQAANSNISGAIGNVTIPGINNMQNTANAPYEQFLQSLGPNTQAFGNSQQGQQNFMQQGDLAQQIQQMMKPSALSEYAPIIQGLLQGGGAAASGTYLCTHLNKLGLMTTDEVKAVHHKIFPYAFLHPIDLISYGIIAPAFIRHATAVGFNWAKLKPLVCDRIIACKTAGDAFRQYKQACLSIFPLMELRHG